MAAIVGVKAAKEVSICRKGANQFAHKLITKSLDTPAPAAKGPEANTEIEDMDVAVMKAIAAMDDITKAYFVGLEDEKAKAFIALSVDAQKAEAKAAADAIAAEKTKAEDAEKARVAGETDVNKRLENAEKTNDELRTTLETMKADRVIEKEASGAEFNGYPGGTDAVVTMLKSIAKVDPETRKSIVDGMKAKAKLASATTHEFGGRTEEDLAKNAPATGEFHAEVRKRASEKGISKNVAMLEVARDPAFAAVAAKAMAEEGVAP
jgi:hypothetical protein